MSDVPQYVVDREFKAPRDTVWKAWTDPKLMSRWYGPGIDTIIHAFDLRPGGVWLNEMKWGSNSDRSKMTFLEVVPGERMVWQHSSTDADWNVIANPMMPNWPRVILTTVTFDDAGPNTSVRLTMVPVDATEAEVACFAGATTGLGKGWGSGFKVLDKMFAEMGA